MRLSPIDQTALFLSVLAAAAVITQVTRDTAPLVMAGRFLVHFVATVGLAEVLFLVFSRLKNTRKPFGNTLVTALIIFVVLAPPEGLAETLLIALTTGLAMAIKFFVVRAGRPLVNPAAGALLIALTVGVFFPETMLIASWWGTAFLTVATVGDFRLTLALLLLIGWVLFGLRRWRKYPALAAFLAVAAGVFAASAWWPGAPDGQTGQVLSVFFDATMLFFASVMVIEPKTSPQTLRGQLLFGGIVGLLFALWHPVMPFSLPGVPSGTNDLAALVIANLGFAAIAFWNRPKKPLAAA